MYDPQGLGLYVGRIFGSPMPHDLRAAVTPGLVNKGASGAGAWSPGNPPSGNEL